MLEIKIDIKVKIFRSTLSLFITNIKTYQSDSINGLMNTSFCIERDVAHHILPGMSICFLALLFLRQVLSFFTKDSK